MYFSGFSINTKEKETHFNLPSLSRTLDFLRKRSLSLSLMTVLTEASVNFVACGYNSQLADSL